MKGYKIILLIVLGFNVVFNCKAQGQYIVSLKDIDIQIDNEYVGGMLKGVPAFNNQIGGDFTLVKTKERFISALEDAKSGSIIYIDDNAVIDLSGSKGLTIRAGVTIASGRGKNGSLGGLIKVSTPGTSPLFVCGSNVKVFGLRFDGGDTEQYHKGKVYSGENAVRNNTYGVPVSIAIKTNYPNLKITNCEFYGWTHAAISIQKGGNNALITYNYIHHNRRVGLGYGVNLDGEFATIKGNVFDYNRHDIAGTGVTGTGYEASFNVFLPNGTSHSVDMHGGKDRNDHTDVAGSVIKVYKNVFVLKDDRRAVVVRGRPVQNANVSQNIVNYVSESAEEEVNFWKRLFAKPTEPIKEKEKATPFVQIYSEGNFTISDNTINK